MVETAIKVIARRLNLRTIVESSRRRYVLWKYENDVGKIMKLFRKEGMVWPGYCSALRMGQEQHKGQCYTHFAAAYQYFSISC
jgi:hypothetical protein